jgi:hypothetical protein
MATKPSRLDKAKPRFKASPSRIALHCNALLGMIRMMIPGHATAKPCEAFGADGIIVSTARDCASRGLPRRTGVQPISIVVRQPEQVTERAAVRLQCAPGTRAKRTHERTRSMHESTRRACMHGAVGPHTATHVSAACFAYARIDPRMHTGMAAQVQAHVMPRPLRLQKCRMHHAKTKDEHGKTEKALTHLSAKHAGSNCGVRKSTWRAGHLAAAAAPAAAVRLLAGRAPAAPLCTASASRRSSSGPTLGDADLALLPRPPKPASPCGMPEPACGRLPPQGPPSGSLPRVGLA